MHARCVVLGLALLLSSACARQSDDARPGAAGSASAEPRRDSLIAGIDSQVTVIDSAAASMRRFSAALTGMSAEGGELDAYGTEGVASGGVRKVVVTHYGESGRVVQRFYYAGFSPDSLVYVAEVRERYDRPLSGTVVECTEHGYYFQRGQLLARRESGGRVVTAADGEAQARSQELRALSERLHRCASGYASSDCSPTTGESIPRWPQRHRQLLGGARTSC